MFKLRKHRETTIPVKEDLVEIQYLAIVNNQWNWFKTKDDLLNFVEKYSQQNVIYSLNMQRIEIYNLENKVSKK